MQGSSDERLRLQLGLSPGMRLHDDPAINAEPPPDLLRDRLTPAEVLFVRNNGTLPQAMDGWTLEVTGLVRQPLCLTVAELRARFTPARVTAVLECAGNGRSAFEPRGEGLPWGHGAVGCAEWSGVRLADVLEAAGPAREAVYIGSHSPDHALGRPGVAALSRGLPIAKAMAPETLLAFEMNGAPLAPSHGFPLRIVAPGFPGSAWQKWLTRIVVLDREHDGAKMTGLDYRLPRHAVAPGEPLDAAIFDVITDMPVKSLINTPAEGFRQAGLLQIAGKAWSGHTPLSHVDVSADGGRTWHAAQLDSADGPWAWRGFSATLEVPEGEVELMARATDCAGRGQPMTPAWNPRGYLNNAVHRVRGTVLPGPA